MAQIDRNLIKYGILMGPVSNLGNKYYLVPECKILLRISNENNKNFGLK
jgi:hypothetical protein